MNHSLWDVRSREQAEDHQYREKIRQYDEALDVIRKATALRTSPGYDDFVKAVENLRDGAQRRHFADDSYTDPGLRESRGRVRAISDVLGLLLGTNAAELLAERRKALQNEFDDVQKRRPKPREEPQ